MNPYEVLGIDSDADADQIRKAFRSAAQKAHPDRNGGDEELFKSVNDAYSLLKDEKRRAYFDEHGADDSGAFFDHEAAARELIISLFEQLLSMVNYDPDHRYITSINESLVQTRTKQSKEIESLRSKKAKLDRFVIKEAEGENLLLNRVGLERSRVQAQVSEIQKRLDSIDLALKIISRYPSDAKMDQIQFTTFSVNTGTRGGAF